MYVSKKTALCLFVLALAGTAGCAAGDAETESDGATQEAPAADDGSAKPGRGAVDVTVNVDEIGSNDSKGGHSCGHGQGWSGHHHGGHHHHLPLPATDPPPPPPPPTPAPSNPT